MVRRTNDQLSPAEAVISEIGKWERLLITFSKDGAVFTAPLGGRLTNLKVKCFSCSPLWTSASSAVSMACIR